MAMPATNRNRFSIAGRSAPDELGRMIDSNEIRDANTLGICARLVARGILSIA